MLLVAQLQHQDPTSAQDANAMVQQLTSFSSLEQMQNMNGLLLGIQVQNQGIFQAQAANLVGKRVRVTTSGFDLTGGKATVGINLAAQADVTITIKDASGKVVATLNKGTLGAGDTIVDWDGKDSSGNQLPDGSYTVDVSAKDASGAAVTAKTSVYAKVDSLTFVDGIVYIMAGGKRFNLSDISEITA
jgi:flagellar basal-body rod modification protein FlgD